MVSEQLRERVRAAGLRVTAQRLAVLNIVQRHPHITAEAIVTRAHNQIGAVSRQAVYDALGTLTTAGILRRGVVEGSGARYEIDTGDNHHHMWCVECGRYEDVDCQVGHAPCMLPSHTKGFAFATADVLYRGLCPDCQAQPTTTPTPSPTRKDTP